MPINQIGRESLSVTTSAAGFASFPASARYAIIYVSTSPIRWRADGTAPTSTTGMFVDAGKYIEFMELTEGYSGVLRNISFIRDSSAGANATLEIAYFS